MHVLAVDVGGTHVKVLVTGESVERKVDSGPSMTAAVMVGAGHVLHNPGRGYGFVVTVIGGGGAVALYALTARFLRVAEFGFLTRTVAAKFSRRSRRH